MLHDTIANALNEQIELEGQSSHVYLTMAVWAETQGFDGVAEFLYLHSEEERQQQPPADWEHGFPAPQTESFSHSRGHLQFHKHLSDQIDDVQKDDEDQHQLEEPFVLSLPSQQKDLRT